MVHAQKTGAGVISAPDYTRVLTLLLLIMLRFSKSKGVLKNVEGLFVGFLSSSPLYSLHFIVRRKCVGFPISSLERKDLFAFNVVLLLQISG